MGSVIVDVVVVLEVGIYTFYFIFFLPSKCDCLLEWMSHACNNWIRSLIIAERSYKVFELGNGLNFALMDFE